MIKESRKDIVKERIIIVLGSLNMGGAQRQALLLARKLSQIGASVQIWGFADHEGRVSVLCKEANIECRFYKFQTLSSRRNLPCWIVELLRYGLAIRRERPDIILPYYMIANVACNLVWRLTGAKLCLWNQRDEGLPVHPRIEALAASKACFFIANSPTSYAYVRETYQADVNKIHLVPNGVETPHPQKGRSYWRKWLNIQKEQFVACMVANLTSLKDHATLITAWKYIIDEFSNYALPPILLLAGKCYNEADSLRKLANNLGLYDFVRFLGDIEDIDGLLQSVDIGVFSSIQEGCPNGVLECMAAGLAVVGTDIPALRYALGPHSSKFLAPPNDPSAFAEKILMLINDSSLRQVVGNLNRNRVQVEFSPAKLLNTMLSLFSTYTNENTQ